MGWPRSLRWRYSLRALFVLITLFMIWGGYHANRGWKVRPAFLILARHGASFGFKEVPVGKRDVVSRLRRGYSRLVWYLWGDAHFYNITIVTTLEDPEVLNALLALPEIDNLDLVGRRLTPDESQLLTKGQFTTQRLASGALAKILKRHRFDQLFLSLYELSDEDCRAIAKHGRIESLQLHACKLSEEGLADVLRTPGLRTIGFTACPVRGERLASVPGSPTLEAAGFSESDLGNDFAKYLSRCPNLRTFGVWDSTVNDQLFDALGPHPSITELGLYYRATDEVIRVLEKMPSLKILTLPPKGISEKGLARLKRAKPDLVVHQ